MSRRWIVKITFQAEYLGCIIGLASLTLSLTLLTREPSTWGIICFSLERHRKNGGLPMLAMPLTGISNRKSQTPSRYPSGQCRMGSRSTRNQEYFAARKFPVVLYNLLPFLLPDVSGVPPREMPSRSEPNIWRLCRAYVVRDK